MNRIFAASARVVDRLGQARFNEALIDAIHDLVAFDTAAMIGFESPDSTPFCLAERAAPVHRGTVLLYIDRYFRNCEVIGSLLSKGSGDAPVILRLSSRDIVDRNYRRALYDRPGIGCELSLLARTGGMFFFLGLYRSAGQNRFSRDDEELIAAFWPFALTSLIKNARLTRGLPHGRWDAVPLTDALVDMLHGQGITRREAEICAYIVSGHSATATALNLDISINTVSTLRQRAYRKLRISCHNELYALCFRRMGEIVRGTDVRRELFDGVSPSGAEAGFLLN